MRLKRFKERAAREQLRRLRVELPSAPEFEACARVIAAAQEPPNPFDEFSEEAGNRVEQDLCMLNNCICTRDVARRLKHYKTLGGLR